MGSRILTCLLLWVFAGCSSSQSDRRSAESDSTVTGDDQTIEVAGGSAPVTIAGTNLVLASSKVLEKCIGSCAVKQYSVQMKSTKGSVDLLNEKTFGTYGIAEVQWRFSGEYNACKDGTDNPYAKICEAKSGAKLTMRVEALLKVRNRNDIVAGSNDGGILNDSNKEFGPGAALIFVSQATAKGDLGFGFSTSPGLAAADQVCLQESTSFALPSVPRLGWYALVWSTNQSLHARMELNGSYVVPFITNPSASDFVVSRDVFALSPIGGAAPKLILNAGDPFLSGLGNSSVPLSDANSFSGVTTWAAWMGMGCAEWGLSLGGQSGSTFGATRNATGSGFGYSRYVESCDVPSRVVCVGIASM